jgi:hypothetical protein
VGCTLGLALGLPTASLASTPGAVTLGTSSTGTTTATVEGQVNPGGRTTQYHVEYGLQSSTWCTSLGSSGAAEHTTTLEALGFTDVTGHFVTVSLTGLTQGDKYCAELLASNGSGTGHGGQVFFTAGVPSVFTFESYSIGTTKAVVEGEVDPNEQATHYQVEYGLASSIACKVGGGGPLEHATALEELSFTDATYHPVQVSLSGLTQGAEYCAEVVAENGSGTEHGGRSFFTAGAPRTLTFEARSTGHTTATVEGEVNPAGQETRYQVAYGQASSTWCRVGFLGSPEHVTPPEPLAFTDATFHPVTATISGLGPGTAYCAELVAVNGSGTERGGQAIFTTTPVNPATPANPLTVSLAGTGSGTVSAPGISCPGTCSHFYADGTHVALTAAPATGSTFAGWSGACTGTGTCSVILNAFKNVTATFTANPATASGGVLGAAPASGSVLLAGSTIAVQRREAAVKLACASTATCRGKLTLTAKIMTKKGDTRHTKRQTIGSAIFSIPAGKTLTIKLKLNGAGRALLSAAHGRLNATLTILKTSPSPSNTQIKSVHLAQQMGKKGKK